jgi:hypothetical protein
MLINRKKSCEAQKPLKNNMQNAQKCQPRFVKMLLHKFTKRYSNTKQKYKQKRRKQKISKAI